MHARNAVRSIEKTLTLADSPYTVLPYIYNVIKVDTTGGNVRVNLPDTNYPIDVIKTSSDAYIVTVWVGGVQIGEVAGELSKITIENAEVTKDEPWYPYDAIVEIAGDEVLAKNRYGKVIAGGRGVAGTDDATVLQAVATTSKGTLFLKKNTETSGFVLSTGITVPPGTFIDSDGALIDVSALNSDVFIWGEDGTVYQNDAYRSGMNNLFFVGSSSNASTKIAKIANIPRNVEVSNISTYNVSNLIEIRGACYGASLAHVYSNANAALTGVGIKFSALNTDYYYPTNGVVDDLEITGYHTTDYVGIGLYAATVGSTALRRPSTFTITNTYLEQVSTGIYSECDVLNISKTKISPYTNGKCIHVFAKYNDGSVVFGSGDNITLSESRLILPTGGYGVYSDLGAAAYNRKMIVSDNWFECFTANVSPPTAIFEASATTHRSILTDNHFIYCHGVYGAFNYGRFANNTFMGENSVKSYIGFDVNGTLNSIKDNVFTYYNKCVDATGSTSTVIESNQFNVCTTPIQSGGTTPRIAKNYGYPTESSGSSTGTGSEQPIAHGLAAIPTGCKAWITYLVGTRYVTEMIPFDATNVYPTVDNGVAYTWRIE